MTRTAWLVVAWCVIGVVVWNGVFDWWLSGATREYLLQAAEFARGAGPEPDMVVLMGEARASGVVHASIWAGLITAAGLLTIRIARR